MSNNNSSNAGVWVKASERLPDKEGQYFVNMPTAAAKTSFYFNGKKFETHSYVRIEEIEWLDEQPIPVNQGINLSELQKRFDEFFANETPETFWAFVEKKRQQEQPYWKQRCEAAEDVLDSLGVNETLSTHRFKDAPYFKEEIENWKRLKSSPSPTTNFNDNEKQSDLFKENNY